MNNICFVIPYFGKFPNYFPLWLKSVRENPSIDFLLFTDNEITDIPKNVKVIKYKFDEIKEYIQSKFDFKIVLNEPYEFCKYKPAYGYIFQEYLMEYDFWGYCDVDLIFGDLRHFITEDILNNYDKILSHGHLSLYRNCEYINKLFTIKKKDCIYYKDVFTTYKVWNNFDEYPYGVSRIAKKENIKIYEKMIFADLDMFFFTFRKVAAYFKNYKDDLENIIQYFKWNNGKLFNIIVEETQKKVNEIAYIHFQKRDMACLDLESIEKNFIIIPNEFLTENKFNENEVMKYINLEKNKLYCNQICEKFKNTPDYTFFQKLLSFQRWKRKWFLFKMDKIYKERPYKFLKGEF